MDQDPIRLLSEQLEADRVAFQKILRRLQANDTLAVQREARNRLRALQKIQVPKRQKVTLADTIRNIVAVHGGLPMKAIYSQVATMRPGTSDAAVRGQIYKLADARVLRKIGEEWRARA